jgi:pyruvate/2-oxoglutarate dehydrogenase complex dihydrolipoamide acyltransferase (E2) component
MTRGSVVRWLVGEGEPLSPHQVFLHVRTDELTEDGSDYLLEVESHESGVLKRILVQAPTTPSEGKEEAAAATLPVGTPLAVFEDPDFAEGDRPRSDFLWQAYVKEGALRQGSCTPQRQEQQEEHEEHHASAADAKAKKQRKAKEPSFSPAAKSKNKGHHAGATDEAGNGRKKPKA